MVFEGFLKKGREYFHDKKEIEKVKEQAKSDARVLAEVHNAERYEKFKQEVYEAEKQKELGKATKKYDVNQSSDKKERFMNALGKLGDKAGKFGNELGKKSLQVGKNLDTSKFTGVGGMEKFKSTGFEKNKKLNNNMSRFNLDKFK